MKSVAGPDILPLVIVQVAFFILYECVDSRFSGYYCGNTGLQSHDERTSIFVFSAGYPRRGEIFLGGLAFQRRQVVAQTGCLVPSRSSSGQNGTRHSFPYRHLIMSCYNFKHTASCLCRLSRDLRPCQAAFVFGPSVCSKKASSMIAFQTGLYSSLRNTSSLPEQRSAAQFSDGRLCTSSYETYLLSFAKMCIGRGWLKDFTKMDTPSRSSSRERTIV